MRRPSRWCFYLPEDQIIAFYEAIIVDWASSWCPASFVCSANYSPSVYTDKVAFKLSERWSLECEQAKAAAAGDARGAPTWAPAPWPPSAAANQGFFTRWRARVISLDISGLLFWRGGRTPVAGLVAAYLLYVLIASPPPTARGGTARCFSSPDD